MTDASVFRTAAEATPIPTKTGGRVGAGDPSHIPDEHEASLFATYEDDQKSPYTAKYFEVDNVWKEEPTLARDLKEIEGYVREQVTSKKVANTVKAAQKFLKELERKAGLSTYESPNKRIDKLLAYIDFRRTVDG